jgi:hypothetical protein
MMPREATTTILFTDLVNSTQFFDRTEDETAQRVLRAHRQRSVSRSLGRHDDADAHFACAAAVHEQMAAPALVARTRLDWAHLLLGRIRGDDAAHASTLLGQALVAGRDLGLVGVERRAGSLLPS